jgi:glycosyltransferase involved in cell wall biosynthesis
LTYGRPVLLGEAVKCFIDQDYPNKELIILNDQDGVILYMDDCPENIHIYNLKTRFGSLGEKRNYIKQLAAGEYFCVWDDDDLYTPFRIRESVEQFQQNPHFDIIKAKDAVLSVNNQNYKIANNLFHSQAIVTKDYMMKTTYPHISTGEDRVFESGAKIYNVDMFPWFWYVYRWGLNVHHVSGIPDEKKSWEKSLTFEPYQKVKGRIKIIPEFKQDYWEDIKNYMNEINPNLGNLWLEKIGRR